MKKTLIRPIAAVAVIAAIGLLMGARAASAASGFNPFSPKAAAPTAATVEVPYVLAQEPVTVDSPDDRTIIKPSVIGIATADAVCYQTAKSATPLRFLVTLTAASKSVITVNYATSNINAGGNVDDGSIDFKTTHGVLMFPKGTTSEYIDVTVFGRNAPEGKEYISLHIYDAVNAKIINAHAIGTIINEVDPGLPRISLVGDVLGPSTKTVWVRVQLSEKSVQTVKVNFQIHRLPGVAVDFSGPSNTTLTFKPGTDQQFVEIHILGDVKAEPGKKIELFSDSISDAVNGVVDETLDTAGVYLID